jgi:hypothetical protein|tara:strand:+ start:379 stop:624 length:246 start_codon:yes stop_codon:yes gene_type:complete
MWYIIWNIENKVKDDIFSFATEKQAQKYAKYYKSLLQMHEKGQHIQKRFGFDLNHKDRTFHIHYKVVEKLGSKIVPVKDDG